MTETSGLMRVPATGGEVERDHSRGWMLFAATLLLLGAAFNAVYGLAAIFNDDYLAEEELLYGSVSVWGWLAMGFAAVQAATAVGLFLGSRTAVLFAVLIAGVNALVHLMAIGGHPLWSVIVMVVDGVVIYGLLVHCFAHGARA